MKDSRKTNAQVEEENMSSFKDARDTFDRSFGELADKMLSQGMTAQEAMGLSPGYLENIYAEAYRLYNTGKYAEAVHLFRILIMFNAMEPKYMLGLAACFHMLKEYTHAVQTYTMCSTLDPLNPIPHYHCADCFIQMKEHLSAMLSLELTIKQINNRPEYAKMKERAQLSLESLKEQVFSPLKWKKPRPTKKIYKEIF